MTKLIETHNAGLFSCFTQALQSLMMYYNYHDALPDLFDRHAQFMHYKSHPEESLIPMLFENDSEIPLEAGRKYFMSNDPREQQFSDYKRMRFDDLHSFIMRWFTPSIMVRNRVEQFKSECDIVPERTIAVFHRANDKVKETKCATDDEWIAKIKEVSNSRLRHIYVLPDSIEFAEKCKKEIDNVIIISQNHLYPANKNSCNFMQVPLAERPDHALNFYASVLIAAQCETLITHSGNGGFWATAYRGHANNLHQYLNGEWL